MKFVMKFVTTICDNLWHFLSCPLPPVPFKFGFHRTLWTEALEFFGGWPCLALHGLARMEKSPRTLPLWRSKYWSRLSFLGGRFGYFLFFLLGGGERGARGPGGGEGEQFFMENPKSGGSCSRRWKSWKYWSKKSSSFLLPLLSPKNLWRQIIECFSQRKTKGQQLKGKIVS